MEDLSNKDLYNKEFLKSILLVIEDEIEDLEKWSAYNSDKYLDEIEGLKAIFEILKEKAL